MIWIALKLAGIGRFLKALPWQFYALAAALLGAWGLWVFHTSAVSAASASGYSAGTKDSKKSFSDAQREADDIDRAEVAKIEARSDAITKETSDAFDVATDDIHKRAIAIRLRHDQEVAARGTPSSLDLPPISGAASEPRPSAPCDGLAFTPALLSLTHNAEADVQITGLIDWAEKQRAVKPQPEGKTP